MINYYNNDNCCEDAAAENEVWDKATLKELKEKYNIIFLSKGNGVHPIKILYREEYPDDPLIVIGYEVCGKICFDKYMGHYQNMFSSYWLKYLIADLKAAKKRIKKINRRLNQR